MKKFAKILSSVIAASMLVSAFAINSFAASKAHNVTLTATEADGVVTVEATMDNTESLVQCGYVLSFDSTAFTADTTKVSRLEKCIDKTWLDGMKDPDGDWAYYLGNPTYKVSADNFNFQWAGAEGVEAEYAMDNRVIGKFYLNVNDGAEGTYTFSLTGITMDAGENSTAAMVCEPVTITIGDPAPAGVDYYFEAAVAGADATGFAFDVVDTTAGLSATTETFKFDTEVVTAEGVIVGLKITSAPAEHVFDVLAKLVF